MYRPFFGASPPPVLTTLVTKILPPHTIGEDHPVPGTSVFQMTFSVCDHLSGSAGSSTTPVDPGPRNCGQLSPASSGVSANTVTNAARMVSFIYAPHYYVGSAPIRVQILKASEARSMERSFLGCFPGAGLINRSQ